MNHRLKGWLGFGVGALLLWWVLKDVPFASVLTVLRASNLWLFAACVCVATCIFPLRARRWQSILEPSVGVLPFGALWRSTAIGMMVSNVFPLKVGELARPLALAREVPRVSVPTAISSLAVDRIFDAIVVFAMMFGAMLDPAFPAGARLLGQTVPQLAGGAMSVMVILMVVCYAVVLQPHRTLSVATTIARRIAPRHEAALVRFVSHSVDGLAVLRDSRRFVAVLGWAIAHWMVNALGIYLGLRAVGIVAPLSTAFFLQGALGLAASLPGLPGFFGAFEGAAALALGVYGVPKDVAVSWALGYHLLTFIPITVIGSYYFTRLGLSMTALRSGASTAVGALSRDAVSRDAAT